MNFDNVPYPLILCNIVQINHKRSMDAQCVILIFTESPRYKVMRSSGLYHLLGEKVLCCNLISNYGFED